ncbi:MAG: hypothetical protein IT435_04385 [Phycisphaerales bacterium]|nr:hypothetical protein [Phycisphaerales bacterium]
MGDLSGRNFGLLIAYLIPGFLVLLGLSTVSEPVDLWLRGVGTGGPSVGSALYVLIASVACGMTASVIRWAVLDTLHHATGVVRPRLDESRLADRLEAFDYLVECHYRYYQFYGNTLVATLVAYAAWSGGPSGSVSPGGLATVLALTAVFVAGSRDALRKYYAGSALLLGTLEQEIPHDQRQAPPQVHHPADQAADGCGADDGQGRHDG